MTSDRRRFIRFDVPLDVIYKPAHEETQYHPAITRNFSRDGCCIESTNMNFKLFDTLDFMVKHPSKEIFVSASGDIVWKHVANGTCSLGIKILCIDKEIKSEILDFAYDLWLEKNLEASSAQ